LPTAYDVPSDLLISKLVEHLRRVQQITPPQWAAFVKTGSHAERPPQERDWWYLRCASLLRKIYLHGPLGLNDLESDYGGRTSVGYATARHRNAGGSAIRKPLQQLEAAGLVAKKGTSGRVLTSKGTSLLDRLSAEILKELAKTQPALARYS
jgi:small subunit ribosomal protein S19e